MHPRTYAYAVTLLFLAFAAAFVPACAATYQLLYAFPGFPHGAVVTAGLSNFGNTLYGTTGEGGESYGVGQGTVFSLNSKAGARVAYAFQGNVNGEGDGNGPTAGLTHVGGVFYGTTTGGGSSSGDNGTVFSFDPTSGIERIIYSFQGGSDGAGPNASLTYVGGTLYGTTNYGGTSTNCVFGCGTVFSLNLATDAEKVVYAFKGGSTDGSDPSANVISVNGILYGTTVSGGLYSFGQTLGTVFAVKPATGEEKVLHFFQGEENDGSSPYAGLTNIGGMLYGTTYAGGFFDLGVVFALNLATGTEMLVYSFRGGSDGASPIASVTNVDGVLYGTTAYGGVPTCNGGTGCGTIFSLNPLTKAETVEHAFQGGSDGIRPGAGLLDLNGTLFGTTAEGGGGKCSGGYNGCGTVFGLTP